MKYNFDEIIDRSNNYAVKYDETKEKFGRDDLIPLWIADMDFKAADPIINALQEEQCKVYMDILLDLLNILKL